MKQNHKKIKIYSEAFCSLVTNFQEFQTTKIMLNDFVVLMKKDSTISAFLQSKSIDRSQKVGIFKNALNDVINNDLLNIIIVMVENDDINLNVDYGVFKNHTFFGSAKVKLENFKTKVGDIENYLTQISSSLHLTGSSNIQRRKDLFLDIQNVRKKRVSSKTVYHAR